MRVRVQKRGSVHMEIHVWADGYVAAGRVKLWFVDKTVEALMPAAEVVRTGAQILRNTLLTTAHA